MTSLAAKCDNIINCVMFLNMHFSGFTFVPFDNSGQGISETIVFNYITYFAKILSSTVGSAVEIIHALIKKALTTYVGCCLRSSGDNISSCEFRRPLITKHVEHTCNWWAVY